MGHYVFDQVTQSWKRGSPRPHTVARVKVQVARKQKLIFNDKGGGGNSKMIFDEKGEGGLAEK